jgi:hypothetical protein
MTTEHFSSITQGDVSMDFAVNYHSRDIHDITGPAILDENLLQRYLNSIN